MLVWLAQRGRRPHLNSSPDPMTTRRTPECRPMKPGPRLGCYPVFSVGWINLVVAAESFMSKYLLVGPMSGLSEARSLIDLSGRITALVDRKLTAMLDAFQERRVGRESQAAHFCTKATAKWPGWLPRTSAVIRQLSFSSAPEMPRRAQVRSNGKWRLLLCPC